jgi:hypothetical protein
MAQMGLETGWGGSGCHNWNVGNIAAFSSWTGDYWVPPWGSSRKDAPSRFRAYPDLRAGVAGYLSAIDQYFPEISAAWKSQDERTVWSAIRRRYMPDRLKPATETAAFKNWQTLRARAYELARDLPIAPKVPAAGGGSPPQ